MSAETADVQVYNINYLININGAVAVPYTPVQNVCQSEIPRAPRFQWDGLRGEMGAAIRWGTLIHDCHRCRAEGRIKYRGCLAGYSDHPKKT